ncbi:hypothetical protein KP509_11G085600 [Ceratopteris richardii]|uniref:Pentatricopeptide repeat-containing protein n=1 Tax=Ceratopteris richardii TaxID=49495 RepID=A0A8T2TTH2_CERRI|nr:hypothetical protein KP509_11G085600 [Ceratopteris richardii]
MLGGSLDDMHCRCGSMDEAQRVFDNLPIRNVVTWSVMIAGYTELGHGHAALTLFDKMLQEGIKPDGVILACLLKACGSIKSVEHGNMLYEEAIRNGFEKDVFVGNTLINLYGKCGMLLEAESVFILLAKRDIASWNVMLNTYIKQDYGELAVQLYRQLLEEDISPDERTFVAILQSCSILLDNRGREVSAMEMLMWLLFGVVAIFLAILNIALGCGSMDEAQRVFDNLPIRNVVTWSVMIAGYIELGHGHAALTLFDKMLQEGIKPDGVILACLLKACGSIKSVEHGNMLYEEAIRNGFAEADIILANTLLDMYINCGNLEEAQRVFDNLPIRNVVTWSVMIAGYTELGHGHAALTLFDKMLQEGIKPDGVILACLLKACGSIKSVEHGNMLYEEAIRNGFEKDHHSLGTWLVDLVSGCGSMDEAQRVFDNLPIRNVVTWSVMIAGYTELGHGHAALTLFDKMLQEGIKPDGVILACLLKACGSIKSVEHGNMLYEEAIRNGFAEADIILANTLLDMYINCGNLEAAHKVFDNLPIRNVVTWSVMIAGYTELGHGHAALTLFDKMLQEGIKPDGVILACLLKACGSIKSVEHGNMLYEEAIRNG